MFVLGKLVGLSYKEVCVIGNIYVQGALWALSSLLPLYATIRVITENFSLARAITTIIGIIYSFICSLVFIFFAYRYRPPLIHAFDLCVDNLYSVAKTLGTTYEVVKKW